MSDEAMDILTAATAAHKPRRASSRPSRPTSRNSPASLFLVGLMGLVAGAGLWALVGTRESSGDVVAMTDTEGLLIAAQDEVTMYKRQVDTLAGEMAGLESLNAALRDRVATADKQIEALQFDAVNRDEIIALLSGEGSGRAQDGAAAGWTPPFGLAEYSRIEMGMTYWNVVDLMGSYGTESASSTSPAIPGFTEEITMRIVTWEFTHGYEMGVVSVTFENDRVSAKAQFGLE